MSDTLVIETTPLDDEGAVMALVTLNQPEQLNPLDWETVLDLEREFARLAEDPAVRTVAVTGAGRAFCAGGNLAKYIELQRDPVGYPRYNEDIHRMFASIGRLGKPFIALVNGVAVAGGLELMLSCDFAFGAASARIGDAHMRYGQMGGGGSLNLLPHAVGPARAREIVLSGRLLDADEALSLGLFVKVVPDGQLVEAALEWSRTLATRSSLAVRNAKQVMNAAYWDGAGLDAGMRLEREVANRYCLTSEDPVEGLRAFAEKREPRFQGR